MFKKTSFIFLLAFVTIGMAGIGVYGYWTDKLEVSVQANVLYPAEIVVLNETDSDSESMLEDDAQPEADSGQDAESEPSAEDHSDNGEIDITQE